MTPDRILVQAAQDMIRSSRSPHATRDSMTPYADALHDALVSFDKRASFTVRFGDKSRRVAGYIFGSFGISDTSSGSSRRWHLTHLGTGFAMPGSFAKKSQAVAYAKAIEPLLPWQDLTDDNSSQYVTPDAAKAIKDAARQSGGYIS